MSLAFAKSYHILRSLSRPLRKILKTPAICAIIRLKQNGRWPCEKYSKTDKTAAGLARDGAWRADSLLLGNVSAGAAGPVPGAFEFDMKSGRKQSYYRKTVTWRAEYERLGHLDRNDRLCSNLYNHYHFCQGLNALLHYFLEKNV